MYEEPNLLQRVGAAMQGPQAQQLMMQQGRDAKLQGLFSDPANSNLPVDQLIRKAAMIDPAYAEQLIKMEIAKAGVGGNTPAALQLANEVARLEAAGDTAGAQRIREFAKTAPIQTEYGKGLFRLPDGSFAPIAGYGEASGSIKGAESYGTTTGKATAENAIAAPAQIAALDTKIGVVKEALGKKGFDANFGKMGYLPNIAGGEAADAATFIDQIRGGAFLTAIGEMKGSGAISEKEGAAATEAVGRFNKAQSPGSARKAMNDLINVMEAAKLRQGKYISKSNAPASPNLDAKMQRLQELRALKAQRAGQ